DIFSRRDTEQRIMRLIHVAARKKHLIGRDERNIEIIGELEKTGLGALFNGEPVPLDLHIEAAWENLHQRARVAFRRRLLIRRDKPPERPADTAGETEDSVRMAGKRGERHLRRLARIGLEERLR